MLIKIHVEKTVQELQYEPFKVSLGLEREVDDKDGVDEIYDTLYAKLEEKVDSVVDERLRRLEEEGDDEK